MSSLLHQAVFIVPPMEMPFCFSHETSEIQNGIHVQQVLLNTIFPKCTAYHDRNTRYHQSFLPLLALLDMGGHQVAYR